MTDIPSRPARSSYPVCATGAYRTASVTAACAALALLLPAAAHGATRDPTLEDLGRLSLEELGNIEVTSVSKRREPLSQAPASVYVITGEAIRRSGATSLAEALRLAPNLHVARLNAREYAITARGFGGNATAANKMLVLIDGRSVYSPLHGGVFWDQKQVVLEDVERIEVVSGPGGTLWGANAVNGVVNVVTRSSRDTQGGLVSGYAGTSDSGATVRYGGRLGEGGAMRAYAMGFEKGETSNFAGTSRRDDWHQQQIGFRSDWSDEADSFTLQGDLFENFPGPGGASRGQNLLGRWQRDLGDRSALTVAGYYDEVRLEVPTAGDSVETFDLEAQHSLPLGQRHEIVWGGGVRYFER